MLTENFDLSSVGTNENDVKMKPSKDCDLNDCSAGRLRILRAMFWMNIIVILTPPYPKISSIIIVMYAHTIVYRYICTIVFMYGFKCNKL